MLHEMFNTNVVGLCMVASVSYYIYKMISEKKRDANGKSEEQVNTPTNPDTPNLNKPTVDYEITIKFEHGEYTPHNLDEFLEKFNDSDRIARASKQPGVTFKPIGLTLHQEGNVLTITAKGDNKCRNESFLMHLIKDATDNKYKSIKIRYSDISSGLFLSEYYVEKEKISLSGLSPNLTN